MVDITTGYMVMVHSRGVRVPSCLFQLLPVALVILGSAVGVDFRVGIFTWGSYHQLSASIMYTGAVISGHTWLQHVGRSQGRCVNMDFTFPIVCFVFLLWRLYSVVLLGSSAWSGLKAGLFAWDSPGPLSSSNFHFGATYSGLTWWSRMARSQGWIIYVGFV